MVSSEVVTAHIAWRVGDGIFDVRGWPWKLTDEERDTVEEHVGGEGVVHLWGGPHSEVWEYVARCHWARDVLSEGDDE